jgi:hypothetical protein
MHLKKALLFFMAFMVHGFAFSQSFLKELDYSLKAHYGFVMAHSVNMAHLANQRPWGLELDIKQRTYGKKSWQQEYNYPVIGYCLSFFNMDKKKPLGNTYSFIHYFSKPIIKIDKSSLSYRIGGGPGFVYRTFDARENYKNNVISAHFNYALSGKLEYSFILKNNVLFNTGVALMHLSNGAMKVPNLGINIVSLYAGLELKSSSVHEFVKDTLLPVKKTYGLNVFTGVSLKETYPVSGPKYFASTISLYGDRVLNRKSIFNAGMDLMFDASVKRYAKNDSLEFSKLIKAGFIAGHELVISKLSILTQFGIYLYDPVLQRKIYQRYGVKYYFTKKIFGGIAMRVHIGNVDYVEWGLGIKI